MKIKRLIQELEMFDKNLDVLVDGKWIGRLDVVDTKETIYDIPYVNIFVEDT